MRLGVFARSAIVASGLWMVGFSYYSANQTFNNAGTFAQIDREACWRNNERSNATEKDCDQVWDRDWQLYTSHAWRDGFIGAALYLIAAWLLLGIAWALWRWIMAGKRNP